MGAATHHLLITFSACSFFCLCVNHLEAPLREASLSHGAHEARAVVDQRSTSARVKVDAQSASARASDDPRSASGKGTVDTEARGVSRELIQLLSTVKIGGAPDNGCVQYQKSTIPAPSPTALLLA